MEGCANISSDANIGPARLTEIFGETMLVVYTVLPLLLLILGLYGLHYRPGPGQPFRLHILLLQLVPVAHLVITFPVLLSPATIPLVSLLQDLLVMLAMLVTVTTVAMSNKNQRLREFLLFLMSIISKTVPTILAIHTGNIDIKYDIFYQLLIFR